MLDKFPFESIPKIGMVILLFIFAVLYLNGWGLLVKRLEDKAPGRVIKINPRYTSQCCSNCGYVDRNSRESQARFRCTACGYMENADVNAAKNIAAGYAVTARGGLGDQTDEA